MFVKLISMKHFIYSVCKSKSKLYFIEQIYEKCFVNFSKMVNQFFLSFSQLLLYYNNYYYKYYYYDDDGLVSKHLHHLF